MSVSTWNNIFELLSMVIIADGRVFKEEVDTFIDCVMEIKAAATDDHTLVTRNLALEWFKGHREEIINTINSPNRQAYEYKLVIKLNDYPHRRAVLAAMIKISLSDDDFHRREESLVNTAAANWDIDLKSLRRRQ
jgi:uncharacterized tellurite resistance protein B-like protein